MAPRTVPTFERPASEGARFANVPRTMGGQFRRHLAPLVFGTLCLAAFQYAMNRIDWLAKTAIDIIFGRAPGKVPHDAAGPLRAAEGVLRADGGAGPTSPARAEGPPAGEGR